jgi:hypothetical protein
MMAGCAFLSAGAQDNPLARVYYPDDLREDLAVLRKTVEQVHPEPYRYRSKAEMDALFSRLDSAITGPLTADAFIAAAMPAIKGLGDAGTVLLPPTAVANAYEHSEPLIPITVAVIGNRLFLDQELKGFRSLPTGCELLQINGRPASSILARLRASLPADGNDTTLLDRRIERDFPVLYRRFVEPANKFTITYRTGEQGAETQDLFALTKDEMRRSFTPKGYALAPWRLEELGNLHTGWLTLETFDAAQLERHHIKPERFLEDVLGALRKDGLTTLVIDVRGAGGGDMAMAEKVFSLVAKAPYRAVQSMFIRSGMVPDSYRYAAPAAEFFASVGALYLPEAEGKRLLRPDDPHLRMLQPSPKAFQGKVYVIGDGGTTGAAAAFVMMANRSRRARTIGEELGSNAAAFCGGEHLTVTLPNSGCVLQVPLTCFVPEGKPTGPRDRGEMPASRVSERADDLAQGKDTVREALLYLIGEMQ